MVIVYFPPSATLAAHFTTGGPRTVYLIYWLPTHFPRTLIVIIIIQIEWFTKVTRMRFSVLVSSQERQLIFLNFSFEQLSLSRGSVSR